MIFYRFESYDKQCEFCKTVNKGPYTNTGLAGEGAPNFNDSIHPLPADDPKLRWHQVTWSEDWIFGFATLADLHKWFYALEEGKGEELDLQKKARIGVYSVPTEHFRAGQFQVIANHHYVKLVDTLPCSYNP